MKVEERIITLKLRRKELEQLAFLIVIGSSVFSDRTLEDPQRSRNTHEYDSLVGRIERLYDNEMENKVP